MSFFVNIMILLIFTWKWKKHINFKNKHLITQISELQNRRSGVWLDETPKGGGLNLNLVYIRGRADIDEVQV